MDEKKCENALGGEMCWTEVFLSFKHVLFFLFFFWALTEICSGVNSKALHGSACDPVKTENNARAAANIIAWARYVEWGGGGYKCSFRKAGK